VAIAHGLADGPHTALIRSAAAPEAFVVGRDAPAPWLWPSAAALLLAALAAVGALIGVALLERRRR
jgi:hypothetical protein